MIDWLKKVIKAKYQPLNKIEISRENLLGNFKYLSSLNPKIAVAPVLKSNAYGHGIELIGKLLDSRFRGNDNRMAFFCVDSLFEAYQLKKAKVKTPILIMGYIAPESLRKNLPFSFAIWQISQAQVLSKFQQKAKVHIFVDTGMNREGVKMECRVKSSECRMRGEYCLMHILEEIKKMGNIEIEGLMSHLSISLKDHSAPKEQMKNFEKALKICAELGIDPKWKHLSASGGHLNQYTKGTNLVRVGRAIYGLDPEGASKGKFKPVLSLKTKIAQIKLIKKAAKVGYDQTYQAKKDMNIGVLPIGYNDGVDRRLSNLGVVRVEGVECKIIGKISMNITTIDLSQVKDPFVGQEVLIFSDRREDKNSIESSAKLAKTIPHDLLVQLDPTIRREIV